MKKITHLFLFLAVALFFIAPVAHAKEDSRCFKKQECIDIRLDMTGGNIAEATEGFYTGPDTIAACGRTKSIAGQEFEMGFCLPVGQTKTGITFGNRDSFVHLGDFLSFMYRYGIIIAGVVAVLVVIVSGIQWTASGGNSSVIDSAKKRIGGAVVGLVIALLSYTILATINPLLVSLRLPQVFLIKEVAPPSEYCDQLPTGSFLSEFGEEGQNPTEKEREILFNEANFTIPKDTAECGKDYFFDSGDGNLCTGIQCPKDGQICVKDVLSEPRVCRTGSVFGRITANPSLYCKDLDKTKITDSIWLMGACLDGETKVIGSATPRLDEDKSQFFFLGGNTAKRAESACLKHGGPVGFYFVAEVNDEGGGLLCATDLGFGEDDHFAIGRNPKNKHQCNVNLSRVVHEIAMKEPLKCENNGENENCLCAGANRIFEVGGNHLMQKEEVQQFMFDLVDIQEGVICDINISRTEFPRQDDDVNFSACYGGFGKLDGVQYQTMKLQYAVKNDLNSIQ